MEIEMIVYTVYVLPDEENRIVDINSSAFLTDVSGWVEIDHGTEDKHHHAQGNYLPKPKRDSRGICRYKLENGRPVERTHEEMDADYTPPAAVPDGSMEGLAAEVAALRESNAQLKEALDLLLSGEVNAE